MEAFTFIIGQDSLKKLRHGLSYCKLCLIFAFPQLLCDCSATSFLLCSLSIVSQYKIRFKDLLYSIVTHQKFEPQKFIFIFFIFIESADSSNVNFKKKKKDPLHIYRELQFHFHGINGILHSTPFRPQSLFWQVKL